MCTKLELKVLWLKKVLGIAVDQSNKNQIVPVTSYYFWPKTDAWKQLKLELDSKPWLSEKEKIQVLNTASDIINYWTTKKEKISLTKILTQFNNITLVKVKT